MYGQTTYGSLLWGANLVIASAVAEVGENTSHANAGDVWGARVVTAGTHSGHVLAGPLDTGASTVWDDNQLWNDSQIWTETIGWIALAEALAGHTGPVEAADQRMASVAAHGVRTDSVTAGDSFVPPSVSTASTSDSASAASAQTAFSAAIGLLTSEAEAAEAFGATEGPLGVVEESATAADLSVGEADALTALTDAAEAADEFNEASDDTAASTNTANAASVTSAQSVDLVLHIGPVVAFSVQSSGQFILADMSESASAQNTTSAVAASFGSPLEAVVAADAFSTPFVTVETDWTAEAHAFSQYDCERLALGLMSEEALAADTWAALSTAPADFIMYSRPRLALLTGRTRAA